MGWRPQNPFLTKFYHQGVLFGVEVSNQIQKLYFKKSTFISINCIRNFKNMSSNEVGAWTTKASKITFRTLSWYIGYFLWLSTMGCLSEKKIVFPKICKILILQKIIKKHIFGWRPQNPFQTIFRHQGVLFRLEVSNQIQKLYFKKFHFHLLIV